MNFPFLLIVHDWLGNIIFLAITLGICLILCQRLIPNSTRLMTDSAAALSQKYWGETWQALVINCTTNIPELFLMLLSLLAFHRLGGIETPFGSNFTNIYLMFMLAPLVLLVKWSFLTQFFKSREFLQLLIQEKSLVIWHFKISLLMWFFAILSSGLISGSQFFRNLNNKLSITFQQKLLLGSLLCLGGILLFWINLRKLRQERPNLFRESTEESDSEEASWLSFIWGSFQVIVYCFCLNWLFLAWSQLYSSILHQIFGQMIFASLHFFIGSLISSIPEMVVAVDNYEKLKPYELNIALSSSSTSNMSNLAIACIGGILAFLLNITSI
jgi:hypothetical protein